MVQIVKGLTAMWRPGFDPWVEKIHLEKGMVTQSSILDKLLTWTQQEKMLNV